jgi:hypothetical protein
MALTAVAREAIIVEILENPDLSDSGLRFQASSTTDGFG